MRGVPWVVLLAPGAYWPITKLWHFLSTLQGIKQDVQPHTQADGETTLVHLELRGVVGARRTARRNAHPEKAAGPLLEEQTHVVTGHPQGAILDRLPVQFV